MDPAELEKMLPADEKIQETAQDIPEQLDEVKKEEP